MTVTFILILEHVFGTLDFSRRDLMALNIQRARDHGLPDYNTIREAYGLQRMVSWEDINRFNLSHQDYPGGSYMQDVSLFTLYIIVSSIQYEKTLFNVYDTDSPVNTFGS